MKARQRIHSDAILIFGESIFDGLALRQLVMAVRPDIPVVKAVERPPTLRRNSDVAKHRSRTDLVIQSVKAAQVKYNIRAMISHRDLDDIELSDDPAAPSDDEIAHCSELSAITKMGLTVIATTPAWEMESWWLMWPTQVSKVRLSWNPLKDRSHIRVDRIRNTKELLKRELKRSTKSAVPEYSETDAHLIANNIRQDSVIEYPSGRAIALERLINSLRLL